MYKYFFRSVSSLFRCSMCQLASMGAEWGLMQHHIMGHQGRAIMPLWLRVLSRLFPITFYTTVNEFIDMVLIDYYDKQLDWDDDNDNDKLNRAFDILERKGIIGRVYPFNVDYAGQLMMTELEFESLDSNDVIGGIFIAANDYYTLCEDGILLFHTINEVGSGIKVLKTAYETLRKAGLNVEWDGTEEDPIMVLDFDWQFRRQIEPHLQQELKEQMLIA